MAENEALFRDVNERIEQAASGHGHDTHLYEFLCECSNLDCDLLLPLALADYERARADATVFIVAPGHDLPEIEEIVEKHGHYQLVRKHGDAAALAEETDPRER